MFRKKTVLPVILSLVLSLFVFGEGFETLEKNIVEKTLPNGLKILILPRHNAPVFTGMIYADVGGVNENQNATGLAHIFEHMAFKGTSILLM